MKITKAKLEQEARSLRSLSGEAYNDGQTGPEISAVLLQMALDMLLDGPAQAWPQAKASLAGIRGAEDYLKSAEGVMAGLRVK